LKEKNMPAWNAGIFSQSALSQLWHDEPRDYEKLSNDNTMVVVYCKTMDAINNLDEMLSVNGVDVILLDLLICLRHSESLENRIIQKCLRQSI